MEHKVKYIKLGYRQDPYNNSIVGIFGRIYSTALNFDIKLDFLSHFIAIEFSRIFNGFQTGLWIYLKRVI